MAQQQVVELVTVYRQALLSPIISLATAIRTNGTLDLLSTQARTCGWQGNVHKDGDHAMKLPVDLKEKTVIANGEHGTVIVQPWKKRVPHESIMPALANLWPKMMKEGEYDPDVDMILCPFNKSFGTIEINKQIAEYLGKQRKAEVYEIIARGQKQYYAVGDRVLCDKQEGIIIDIERNYGYIGRQPVLASTTLNRWGYDPENPDSAINEADVSADSILNALENLAAGDEDSGTNKASHVIKIKITDTDETITLTTAGEVNALLFSYALTVHKSQGSEWGRVIVMLHGSHATMLSRELLYTAVTRAKQELIIFCEGDGKYVNQITAAAERPDIPGTTLADKIAYFTAKAQSFKTA
jgi:ATP-dependent exoDNAse (exonuclease V) alpha subunit